MKTETQSGDGMLCRLYARGGEHRDLARTILRRQYADGKQSAFCYHGAWLSRVHLERLRAFLEKEGWEL
jgi:hypothetical protein